MAWMLMKICSNSLVQANKIFLQKFTEQKPFGKIMCFQMGSIGERNAQLVHLAGCRKDGLGVENEPMGLRVQNNSEKIFKT